MKRKSMSKGRDRKKFRSSAMKENGRNRTSPRGGYRL